MQMSGVLLLWGFGSLFTWSCFVMAHGNSEDDEWIDPYDMLNYDASSKSMKKPAEVKCGLHIYIVWKAFQKEWKLF